ncbi:MAG TPA: hypothetical protein VG371_03345 [Solirubrobacteraceae bacterium]|jgi:hypothetical protein|nr:hypothetical protein [Solirubrobacteraceae bacterium]
MSGACCGSSVPVILGAYSAWGFSGAFIVMAICGVVTAGLVLLGIQATGRSLETATAAKTPAAETPVA